MKDGKREYRVTARFAGDTKRHVVGGKLSQRLTLEQAQELAAETKATSDYEIENNKCKLMKAGTLAVDTECDPDYVQVDIQIQYRDVSPWEIYRK